MKHYYPLTNGTAFMGMRAEAPYNEWGPHDASYYLASDVDRLREEARERVAHELEKTDMTDGAISYHEWADRILAEVFKEASDDGK